MALGISKRMLKSARQISAVYAALMAFEVALYLGLKSIDTPLKALGFYASIAGTLVGAALYLSVHYRQLSLVAAFSTLLGIGHIAYAVAFAWLWEGDLFDYARAGISAGFGLIFFGFAKWVANFQKRAYRRASLRARPAE